MSPGFMEGVENLQIRNVADGAVIAVKVVAGSSCDKVVGVLGGALKIATAAAPEKGKANAAVTRTLAKALGVYKRSVEHDSGQTNPRKEVCIAGMTRRNLLTKLRRI